MSECTLELTYNDDTWAAEVSPDQTGCNQYIERFKHAFMDTNALHVGIGTSSIFVEFFNVFKHIDGITIMQSEIDVAEELKRMAVANAGERLASYEIYEINKYDAEWMDELVNPYELIIDNNLSHYACCQAHWENYFKVLVKLLRPGGMILTHTQGFSPHTRNIGHLTIDELRKLSGDKLAVMEEKSLANSYGHYPVTIRKHHV